MSCLPLFVLLFFEQPMSELEDDEAKTVFFGRLTDYVTEEDLCQLCESIGPVR